MWQALRKPDLSGNKQNAVYPKIGGKRKFMDLPIMNSPVSLGIVLSIR